MYCKEAEIATEWWIDLIKKQYKHENPEKIIGEEQDFIITDECFLEELSRFREVLIKEIHKYVELNSYLSLSFFHFAYGRLAELLQEAQFSRFYLPLRVGGEMRIEGKSIEVSIGKQELRPLKITSKH